MNRTRHRKPRPRAPDIFEINAAFLADLRAYERFPANRILVEGVAKQYLPPVDHRPLSSSSMGWDALSSER